MNLQARLLYSVTHPDSGSNKDDSQDEEQDAHYDEQAKHILGGEYWSTGWDLLLEPFVSWEIDIRKTQTREYRGGRDIDTHKHV